MEVMKDLDKTEKIIIDKEYYYDLRRKAEANEKEIEKRAREKSMKMGVANVGVIIDVRNNGAAQWNENIRYKSTYSLSPFAFEESPWLNPKGKFYISERMRRRFERALEEAVKDVTEGIVDSCNRKSSKYLFTASVIASLGWLLFALSLIF